METQEAKQTQEKRGVITGEEGGPIELEKAADWTANHRHRHPNETISQFFGQILLKKILDQPGCLGLRIYYANSQRLTGWQRFFVGIGNFFIKVVANAEGEKRIVLTGVTETGEDQLPHEAHVEDSGSADVKTYKLMYGGADNTLGDDSHPCPGSTGCPKNKLTH